MAAQIELSRLELSKGAAGAAGAAQYAEQALTAQPGNPVARLLLVRSLLAQRDVARAESELKELLQRYPKVAAVHVSQGNLQLLKQDLPGARASFEKAAQLEPNSDEPLVGLVTLDLAERKPDNAKRRVEARLAAAPKDPGVLLIAARTYGSTGDLARTEQLLLQALQVAPENLQAYSMLGQLYIQQRKLDEARQKFEEIAKRQPKAVGAHTMVAMILQMQGNAAEAQKRYEKVLEIDPRAPVAANNLAWMYSEAKGGNLDMALQLAQTAKAKLPDAPEVNDTLGWIYYKKDLASLAVPPLQLAAEKDPKNPTYQFHLGMALAKAGKPDKAKTALEAALKLAPTSPNADEARKTLASLQKS